MIFPSFQLHNTHLFGILKGLSLSLIDICRRNNGVTHMQMVLLRHDALDASTGTTSMHTTVPYTTTGNKTNCDKSFGTDVLDARERLC